MSNFVFACGSVNGLTLAQKRETLKALRESIKAEVAAKRDARAVAKLEAMKNPVGTKARKAATKPSKVKVYKGAAAAELMAA